MALRGQFFIPPFSGMAPIEAVSMWDFRFLCSRSRERAGIIFPPNVIFQLPSLLRGNQFVQSPYQISLKFSLLHVFVHRCDVFTAVRKLRAQRQGMIQELVSDVFLNLIILEISFKALHFVGITGCV